MSRELARQALQLFEQALDLPAEELEAFLDRSCGDNTELREQVESLLASNSQAAGLFPSTDQNQIVTSKPVESPLSAASSPAFAAEAVLAGRYQIRELIGTGGMGEVYRAHDQRLGREVAIKTLKHAGLGDRELQNRFDREMRVVAALAHPNVVTLYDVADHGELKLAVMEFVPGQTLAQLIEQKIDAPTALKLARDIALGLAAAHDCSLMHRDIKPENVVVTGEGHAKVLDFGLARPEVTEIDQAITVGNLLAGTIAYMSPEQAESQELTCATDIFSLGVLLYEMLSGTHPFRDETPWKTLSRVTGSEPAPLEEIVPDIPGAISDLVKEMLAKSPEQRPTARQVAEQIAAFDDNQTSTASSAETRTGPVPIPQEQRSRRWQPSLIVLPFQVFGNDAELEAVSDGLVENLTTVLTRVPMLSLASRMSSFTLKGQSQTANEVRQRFGVDYMIEGSLQRFGDQLRANVQLIETRQGFHLWAQQFDCADDETAMTDLLHEILPRMEPQLIRAIFNDLRDESGELNGRQLLVQSMTVLSLKGWHRDSFSEVAELLRKSIDLEPGLALAHAYLALIRGLGKRVGLVADPETAVQDAIAHAEQALDLDDMDSNVLGLAGCALSDIGQTQRGLPILRKAIELNPNNAQAHAALGAAHLMDEEYEEAIEHLRRGIDLSPLDGRLAVWYALLAICHLLNDEPDEAYQAAVAGCQSDRKTYMPHVVLTSIQLARGDSEAALLALSEALRIKPDLSQDEINHLVGRELGKALRKLRREYDATSQN